MKHKFWKYQGTGNDFIFFDGRGDVSSIKDKRDVIAKLCDRRFGIGADGLIILEEDGDSDFRMIYYNSDGGESTMCGNGGRCSIAFANFIGLAGDNTIFEAIDGKHDGQILEDRWVELGMINVSEVIQLNSHTYEMNTGSPHYVRILKEGEKLDIVAFGKQVRYGKNYAKEGINVNTVRVLDDGIHVETYERGVEGQTLSCGTGVTASAIAYYEFANRAIPKPVGIETAGGNLKVAFQEENGVYSMVVLSGPATQVFEGVIDV